MFQPAPNCVKIILNALKDSIPCENVWHAYSDAPFDLGTSGLVAAAVANWWTTSGKNQATADVLGLQTSCQALDSEGEPTAVNPISSGGSGALTSPDMPNNVTIAIKHLTSTGGRSGHGRTYWIGTAVDQSVEQNQIQAAYAASLISTMSSLKTAINSIPPPGGGTFVKMCVLSRQQNKVVLPNAIPYEIIGFQFTDLYVDSQRRRLPAHNRHR